jgi:environmental stress-induced protein Ves
MTVQVFRASDHRPVPWRNGGGTTWEVAQAPAATSASGFLWRASFAAVTQDGPFSSFPGVDRTITVVQGSGMTLTVDGTLHELGLHEPFGFSGEAATSARVTGATIDFNMMVDRRHLTLQATVRRLASDELAWLPPSIPLLVAVLAGTATVHHAPGHGRARTLGERDVVVSQGVGVGVSGPAVLQINRLGSARR